jgi:hypothetical protein
MSSGVYGWATRLAVAAADPAIAGERLNFDEANVVLVEDIFDGNGMRGTRSSSKENTRPGLRHVSGPIRLKPTPVEWAVLLPWIYGGTPSGTSYPLADALGEKYVMIGRDDGTSGKVYVYNGCKVDKATIRSTRGGAVTLDLEVVGKDETVSNAGTAGSFPALTFDATAGPFMFFDASGAITVASTPREVESFELVIDNHLDRERFENNITLSQVNPMDRTITCSMSLPYGAAEAVYNSGSAGVATVATFTNASVSLALTMAALVFGRRSPTWQGKNEVMQSIQGRAYMSSTTKELTTVLDSTF